MIWQFANSFNSIRAAKLLGISAYSEVVECVAKAQVTEFIWEPFKGTKLAGCNRASYLLRVSRECYDAFFNSPVGYRGQYALSVHEGEAANRYLLTALEEKLINFASTRDNAPLSAVLASLQGSEAKVWIFESEVEIQLGEDLPAILFSQWEKYSETGVGLLAPVGMFLEVKGGWLDCQGREQHNPSKVNRSNEIHKTGYS